MFEKEFSLRRAFPSSNETPRPQKQEYVYEFGCFQLDPAERLLTNSGELVSLTPKAFDTLCALVEHSGRLLSKNQLLEMIWPDTYVEEKTLAQNIFTLRKTLGTDKNRGQFIETVPKKGYRFSATVRQVSKRSVQLVAPPAKPAEHSLPAESENTGTPAAALYPINTAVDSELEPDTARPDRFRDLTTRKKLLVAGFLLVAVAALIIGGLILRNQIFSRSKPSFAKFQISKLTNTGDVGPIGLSRDGRYVAYIKRGPGEQSIVVRQIDSSSALEILPPERIGLIGVTFAADGNSVFYVALPYGEKVAALYQISILGGTPRKIIDDVDSPVAVSPDGNRIAYVRQVVGEKLERQLIIASVKGTDEQVLASSTDEALFSFNGPAWSPDGNLIALSKATPPSGARVADILVVSVKDGSVHSVGSNHWNWVGPIAWLSEPNELLFTASRFDEPEPTGQIWLLPYPNGEARRVTNEVDGHFGIGVASDRSLVASTEGNRTAAFWVSPTRDPKNAKPIAQISSESTSEPLGLSWASGEQILYSSTTTGKPEVWSMNSDGSGRRQISSDNGINTQPVATPDGKFVVYVSRRNGALHIWRMDQNGGNAKQLTTTLGDRGPSVTPDGKWVVYSATQDNKRVAMKVSIEGGTSTRLSQFPAIASVVSPDGKTVACYLIKPDGKRKLALISFDTGDVLREFEVYLDYDLATIKWTPDGQALTYVRSTGGVANIWAQPISGGPPKQITAWDSDIVFRFDWSKDGRLVAERGRFMADIILIRPTN